MPAALGRLDLSGSRDALRGSPRIAYCPETASRAGLPHAVSFSATLGQRHRAAQCRSSPLIEVGDCSGCAAANYAGATSAGRTCVRRARPAGISGHSGTRRAPSPGAGRGGVWLATQSRIHPTALGGPEHHPGQTRGCPQWLHAQSDVPRLAEKTYCQRAQIETDFSTVKRKLSSRAPGCRPAIQIRQALLLGFTCNLYRLGPVLRPAGCRQSHERLRKNWGEGQLQLTRR